MAGSDTWSQCSDFSFVSEVARQTTPSVGGSETSSGRAKRTGCGKQSIQEGVACRLCTEAAAAGSPYCWPHKRTFGWLCKQACKDKTSDLYTDYRNIFGEGRKPPPDQALADRVLIELHEADLADERKGIAARKKADLTRYRHLIGTRHSTDDTAQRRKWDEELFTKQMCNLRGWTKEKAYQHWRKFEQDPSIKRDFGGVGGALRLAIPPNYTGDDFEEDRKGRFEERSVEQATKQAKVDAETTQKWIADTHAGFSESNLNLGNNTADLRQEMLAPLPASSVGQTSTPQAMFEFLLNPACVECVCVCGVGEGRQVLVQQQCFV